MNFERRISPKETLNIGSISFLKEMNGIILSENQSWQNRKWRDDPDIWKDPKIKTAADFDWLDHGLLSKIGIHSIVIEIHGNEFYIDKNISFRCTSGYYGDIKDLNKVILYWYHKNRKWRKRKRYLNGKVFEF